MVRTFYRNTVILSFYFFSFFGKSNGQENKDTTTVGKAHFNRSLILAVDYSSDRVFYGRRSAERILYFSPSLFYQGKSGFYSGFASYRIVKPVNRWDELHLIAGWDFMLGRAIYASASYSRFAYSDSSIQIQSSLKNNVEVFLQYDSSFIVPRLTGGLYFGKLSPDYLFAFDLSHKFEFYRENHAFFIKPSVNFSAGTVHYYNVSLRDTSLRRSTTAETTQFNLTGIDFSLLVEYDVGRFIFLAAANYNIPNNQPRYLELEPGFYFTLGVGFRIL